MKEAQDLKYGEKNKSLLRPASLLGLFPINTVSLTLYFGLRCFLEH